VLLHTSDDAVYVSRDDGLHYTVVPALQGNAARVLLPANSTYVCTRALRGGERFRGRGA
jgi:hypothetical protein